MSTFFSHDKLARTLLGGACLFMISSAALAAVPADGCTTTSCTGKIQDIYLDDTDEVYVTPPEGNYQNLPCTLYGSQYFKLSPSHKKYKEIFTTLTASLVTQSKIQLRTSSDASGFCMIKYVVMYKN